MLRVEDVLEYTLQIGLVAFPATAVLYRPPEPLASFVPLGLCREGLVPSKCSLYIRSGVSFVVG